MRILKNLEKYKNNKKIWKMIHHEAKKFKT